MLANLYHRQHPCTCHLMGAWFLESTVPLMGGEYTPIQSSGEGLSTFSHVTVTQSPEWLSSVVLMWKEMVKLSPVLPPLPVPLPVPVSFPVPVPPCDPACCQSEDRIPWCLTVTNKTFCYNTFIVGIINIHWPGTPAMWSLDQATRHSSLVNETNFGVLIGFNNWIHHVMHIWYT